VRKAERVRFDSLGEIRTSGTRSSVLCAHPTGWSHRQRQSSGVSQHRGRALVIALERATYKKSEVCDSERREPVLDRNSLEEKVSDPTVGWFALMVKPRFEKSVSTLLRSKGLEDFTPMTTSTREWSDRQKTLELPMFPRYVFCRFSFESRVPVLSTPGVLRVVGFGPVPCQIPEAEIEALRMAVRAGVPLMNCDYLAVGQRVRVLKGPLTGVEGLFVEWKSNARIVLSIHLLQRSLCAEVDVKSTQPVQSGGVNPGGMMRAVEAHGARAVA
jgi:transcriptional antiterminator NusG